MCEHELFLCQLEHFNCKLEHISYVLELFHQIREKTWDRGSNFLSQVLLILNIGVKIVNTSIFKLTINIPQNMPLIHYPNIDQSLLKILEMTL